MDVTKTSAREIADQTGINVTLLSKFKNDQRKLQYNSKYPTLLADFFLQCRAEQTAGVVRELLERRGRIAADASPGQEREALSLWLCSELEEEKKEETSAQPVVEVLRSVSELKDMLERFTQRVLAAAPGRVSVVHDFPDMELSTSLLEFSLPYLDRIRKHGNPIRILDNCPAPKTYMSVFNWMEFYFSDRVEIFADPAHSQLYRMTFLLEGECALFVLASAIGQTRFLCTLYDDPQSAAYFGHTANLAIPTADRVIEKIPFNSIMDFLHALDRFLTGKGTTFLINPVMMYKTMNLELLDRVLAENGVPETIWPASYESNRFTAYLRTKCPYKQLYDLTAMTRVATMDATVDEELSAVYGRPISVSRRHLHQHLQQLTRLNAPEKYHLLFVPFERLQLLHSSISYVIQQDSLFLAWDTSRSDHRIYSRDPSIANAAYHYMEEIWNSVPAEYTTPEWQREQLQMLLELSAD